MPALLIFFRAHFVALVLLFNLHFALPAHTKDFDRVVQMTAVFDEVEPALRALATCRLSSHVRFSEKAINEIKATLAKAGLTDQSAEKLLQRMKDIRPLLADDRPVAELLVLCHSILREKAFSIDTAFSLMDRLTEAAAQPPGKDDAQIIEVMTAMVAEQNSRNVCMVSETPLPKRTGISPEGAIGKELKRFDISPAVRSYIESLYARETDFSEFATIGTLRNTCIARSDAFKKYFDANNKPPPGALEKLKAMQPVR